jgi:hypothetical protein
MAPHLYFFANMTPIRLFLLLAIAAAGCAEPTDISQRTTDSTGTARSAGSNDDGTRLTATATAGGPVCRDDGTAQVTFRGAVTSTGSVDSVEITAAIDGGAPTQIGVIEPQDFTHSGRNKVADYAASLSLDNGSHEIVLCFTQSGAQGREPKQFCTDPITVVVACEACGGGAPFGDIVGNPNLCNGNGPPHVPIHVRGDLGDTAVISIGGPGGYSFEATMDHAGDSCIYQYNWDTTGNGGPGTYGFVVTGANGRAVRFNADLTCQ